MTWARPSLPDRETRLAERAQRNAAQAQTCIPRRAAVIGGGTAGPVPKECASQHAGYQDAVRDLGYCMLCRRHCRPQFAHADQGKGQGIKTDVRRGWPGCGPGAWGPGCHWIVGMSGQYTKEERRALEEDLGRRTRAAVLAAGTWPKRLEQWP